MAWLDYELPAAISNRFGKKPGPPPGALRVFRPDKGNVDSFLAAAHDPPE